MTELRRILLRVVAGTAVAATLGGCFAAQPTHRYFQPSADQVGPYANSFGEAVVPRHGLIVVQGDSLAYGSARRRSSHAINGADEGQAAVTISQSLRRVLRGQVMVENRGFPADTAATSATRWASGPKPDLAILCFGYSDMAAHTPPLTFGADLAQLIDQLHARGVAVFVVKPPSSADPLVQSELAPYAGTVQAAAMGHAAEVFDADVAMTRIKAAHAKTAAQQPDVYQAIAADILPYVKVVDPSPHVEQAGSGDSRTVRASAVSPS